MIAQILDPASYSFDPYAIPLLVTALAVAALWLVVFHREKWSLVSLSFMLMAAAVVVWLLTLCATYSAVEPGVALWWAKAGYLGIPFIAPGVYTFTLAVLGKFQGAYRLRAWLLWAGGVLFALAGTSTGILISGVHRFFWGWYGQYAWLGTLFVTYTVVTVVASVLLFYEEYQSVLPGIRKRRMRVLMMAFAVSSLAAVDFIAVYGLPVYPFGYLGILGFTAISAHAVWVYHLRDITPALAANQIIETMFNGVLVLDREGHVQVANPAACRMLSVSREVVVGQPVNTLLPGFGLQDILSRLRSDQGPRNYDVTYQPRDAPEPRFLNLTASTIQENDTDPLAVVYVMRDVTEDRKKEQEIQRLNEELESRVLQRTAQLQAANLELETEIAERARIEKEHGALFEREQKARAEAEAAVRAREQLLYIVSHDLRNPLSVVKVGTTMIRRRFARESLHPDDIISRGLEQIETAGNKMNRLINELLDFARMQVGQPIDIRPRPTDLVALARQVARQYEHLQNRHVITVDSEPAVLVGLWDAERLERVLDNLVANAVKYSPMGGPIDIHISRDEDLGRAQVTIHDEGIGIPASDLPHIFDWFRRGSNAEGHIEGTGIGLPSAYQVIEAHGGTIAVQSEEGLGSTFTVSLPWAPLGTRVEVGPGIPEDKGVHLS